MKESVTKLDVIGEYELVGFRKEKQDYEVIYSGYPFFA